MYAFYDFETTGANTAFDQPLQFAAILTDEKFNELETVNIRCRLMPHILPSPWAMHVTGITPETLMDKELPTLFEFGAEIQHLVKRWSPSVWTGYNSISFDELVMRQLFYQNLQPDIYATQSYGNTRLDILNIVYATFAFEQEALTWPSKDTGGFTFKLDKIAPENGFNEHDAHDALGDVRATIFIAKLIQNRCPELWENCVACSNKSFVNSLIEKSSPLSMVFRFGQAPPKQYDVISAGRSWSDGNKVAVIDLNELDDVEQLNDLSSDAVSEMFKKSPKIIRTFRTNSSPILRIQKNPSAAHTFKSEAVAKSPDLREKIADYITSEYKTEDSPDEIELKIYDNFSSETDKNILERLRSLTWPERKVEIAKLSDPRFRKLGTRALLLEAPSLLTIKQRLAGYDYFKDRWINASKNKRGWTTFGSVQKQLEELVKLGLFSEQKKNSFDVFYSTREEELKKAFGL